MLNPIQQEPSLLQDPLQSLSPSQREKHRQLQVLASRTSVVVNLLRSNTSGVHPLKIERDNNTTEQLAEVLELLSAIALPQENWSAREVKSDQLEISLTPR